MKIKEIELKNFRAYKGYVNVLFKNSLVYITGENNVGKSTIFDAIDLLLNGTKSHFLNEKNIHKEAGNDDMFINLTFSGDDISEVISEFSPENKKEVFLSYIYQEDGIDHFSISRSLSTNKWINSRGQEKESDPGTLCIYNKKTGLFENPSGIESPLQNLFNCVKIEANSSVEDNIKSIKHIIADLSSSFEMTDQFKKLQNVYNETFNLLKNSECESFTNRLNEILKEQYDSSLETKIDFYLPELTNLLSNFQILVDDGIETEYCEKGHGLQRSIALALIQIASEIKNSETKKPTFYLIDEPEVYLHPNGQHQLRDALENLSGFNTQVFISTHSTYILDKFNHEKQDILVLNKKQSNKIINKRKELGILFSNPTPSEIAYIAFNIPSFEFHNELFNFIQSMDSEEEKSVKAVDNILKNYNKFTEELEEESGYFDNNNIYHNYSTLTTKIRNEYHHGDIYNLSITEELLVKSIELMRNYIKDNKGKNK